MKVQLGGRLLVLLLCSASGTLKAQFSPGPLSKAHSSLAGPVHCISCHALSVGSKRFKCLNCHVDIRQRLVAHRGLHARLVKKVGDQRQCVSCHSEHNGERFVPIKWDVDLSEFDHGKTGYELEGKHRGLDCRRCHAPEHIAAAERKRIYLKNLKRTYLGLSQQCQGCHADEHRGQLASTCEKCHGFTKWKPAPTFDHAKAKFPLEGAHEKVACQKCHPTVQEGKPFVKFAGLSFAACTPCHQDPHHGAFQASCQSCHSLLAWKPAQQVTSRFDHSRTKFPLAGKHAAVACQKCHRTSNFKEPVAHVKCIDCHTTDIHGGQFLARADHGECGSCHVVEGWRPTTFDVAQHRRSRYPLEGRHASVACAKCHRPAGRDTVYKVKFERCGDCHADAHQTQFAGRPYENRCEQCHTVKGFRPSTFALARHRETRFALAGAHLAVACAECHKPAAGAPREAARYRFEDRTCVGCHEDPHNGQFGVRLAALRTESGTQCEACHSLRTWRDLAKFDHSKTKFLLAGAHRSVTCAECHRPLKPRLGVRGIVFRGAALDCAGCHEDVHAGQFARNSRPADCSRCHEVLKWKPSTRFDHDRDSNFVLTGAHQRVACALCHKTTREVRGKLVLMYKPTPQECSGCHGPEMVAN